MDVSVVIPALNAREVIDGQLDALAAQETTAAFEVVVADNGSTDGMTEHVEKRVAGFPVPLRVVDASAERGVGQARNIGAEAAVGRVIAFCDADDRVAVTWVQAAYDGVAQGADFLRGPIRQLLDPFDANAPVVNSGYQDVDLLQGGNLAASREAFMSVGGFDASLPPYGVDDGEFSVRVRKAGFPTAASDDFLLYFRSGPVR